MADLQKDFLFVLIKSLSTSEKDNLSFMLIV